MTQEKKVILIIGIITLVLMAGGILFLSKPVQSPTTTASQVDTNLLVQPDSYKTSFPSSNVASPSAKVTIVEFADFECPACAEAKPSVEQILKDYQGKITVVFRNFPLPQHPNARKAAEAAEAAGEQGKFWQMYDKLFTNQDEWASLSDPTDKFVSYAQSLGLDTTKFKQVIDSNKYENKLQRDWNDGVSLNVNETPTFFINGVKMETAPTVADFHTAIDAQLNK